MHKPDTRPLSTKTGYMYAIYLQVRGLCEYLNGICQMMEREEPWYDPEYRKKQVV